MEELKLEPADILVKINRSKDPFPSVKRWALGSPYDHVCFYMGKVGILTNWAQRIVTTIPMIFESHGRGCNLRLLSERYGEEAVVMRLKSEYDRRRIPYILEEAIKLASEDQARYDYSCIIKFVLPRLICGKLGLPMPLKYHRDPFHICSEAIFEVFYRGGLEEILLPYCIPPLPGDFVINSILLKKVGEVLLGEGVV